MCRYLSLCLILTLAAGCSSSTQENNAAATMQVPPTPVNVSFNKEDYPVFPDADAGADPSVPAEQGGKDFKGEGWQTNTTYDLIGDPRAVKGGVFRQAMTTSDFPTTLRYYGPNTSLWNF